MLKRRIHLTVVLCLVLISSVADSEESKHESQIKSDSSSIDETSQTTLTARLLNGTEITAGKESEVTDSVVTNVEEAATTELTNSFGVKVSFVPETTPVNDFIVPNAISKVADSFVDEDNEYIIVQASVSHHQAMITCKHKYNGILATVINESIANFLAEALSETNLDLNSLWVGARKTFQGWSWISGNNVKPVDTTLFNQLLCKNPHIKENSTSGTQCLAFGRSDHLDPQFRILNCAAYRSFICQKEATKEDHSDNSTHSGWIKIGKRSFKIFYNQISWEQASTQCTQHNDNASLAIITSFKETQVLGRYLLIGRPSLENAWIGARYNIDLNSYYYYSHDLKLPNATESQVFPPWKRSPVGKPNGCVLLDRHVSNMTVFMEARCDRHRSYICSIEATSSEKEIIFNDVIIGTKGYRLIYDEKSWNDAFLFCRTTYKKYGAQLVVISSYEENFSLLYLMGEHRSDVQHIWVGGRYVEEQWQWAATGTIIELSSINLVNNYTYYDEVERGNLCLNMDRENHMTGFHYGTDCTWPQPFVCGFTSANLIKLQNDEIAKIIDGMR